MRAFVLTFCTSISLAAGITVDGLILRVEPGRILVAHRPIPGYMPAMVMPFEVQSMAALRPGLRVQFEIERGSSAARRIKIVGEELDGIPKPPPQLAIGDAVPRVELVDHNNQPLSLAGTPAVINFIYTRCPLPNVCPRQSAAFAALSGKFPGARFISVSLDPEFDTPERLAEYARRWRAGNWQLATGRPDQVRRLAESLGVTYWPEEGVLAHSSATAIINRDGRLAALVEGAEHRVDQLASLIGAQLEDK